MADVKPGWQTSELWLALAADVAATVLLGLRRITPAEWTTVTGGSAAVYALVRGVVKYSATPITVTARTVPVAAVPPVPAVAPGISAPGGAAVSPAATTSPPADQASPPRLP